MDGYLKTKKTEEESDIPKNNFNENKLEYWYVYRVIWVCSRKKGPAITICRVVRELWLYLKVDKRERIVKLRVWLWSIVRNLICTCQIKKGLHIEWLMLSIRYMSSFIYPARWSDNHLHLSWADSTHSLHNMHIIITGPRRLWD